MIIQTSENTASETAISLTSLKLDGKVGADKFRASVRIFTENRSRKFNRLRGIRQTQNGPRTACQRNEGLTKTKGKFRHG